MSATATFHEPAQYAGTGYIGMINAQWATHADTVVPSHWAGEHAALAGTAGEVLAILRGLSGVRAYRLLHALLRIHHAGTAAPDLAGRILIQTMLGSAQRLTRTAKGRHLDDPAADAVTALWAAITAYPLRRTTSVAANLCLDALHHLPAAATAPVPAGDSLEVHIDRAQAAGRLSATDGPSEDEAAATLRWAHEMGVLDVEEIRLLAQTYLAEDASTSTVLAQRLGLSPAALRKRQSRAVAKLAAAVAERLDHPAF